MFGVVVSVFFSGLLFHSELLFYSEQHLDLLEDHLLDLKKCFLRIHQNHAYLVLTAINSLSPSLNVKISGILISDCRLLFSITDLRE